MPRIEIEAIEWTDGTRLHATRHGVSVDEINSVFDGRFVVRRNRMGRTGDFVIDGQTTGGRSVRLIVAYDATTRTVRPITAWEM